MISLSSEYNDFGEFPPNFFKNLRLLEKVEMIHNNFKSLSSKLFQFNHELKYFTLMKSRSKLVLPGRFLANKPRLLSVTLTSNFIETVPNDIFHKSINIEEIDLSDNFISTLIR